jgi:hypothetical protein
VEHADVETDSATTAPADDPSDPVGRTGTTEDAVIPDPADPSRLQAELDRLSLAQALVDTEMANARVIDLTERLVGARQEVARLRGELEELRIEHARAQAEHQRMQSSQAYRLASRIWAIRNVIGR